MKKTVIILFVVILSIFTNTNTFADDNPLFVLEINQIQISGSNKDGVTIQSDFPQLRLKVGHSVYLAGSYERANVYYIGQESLNIEIYGVAIGYKHKVSNKLIISADIGWYQPNVSYPSSGNAGQEGHWLYMNNAVWPLPPQNRWESYKTEVSGAVGLTVGATYHFTKYVALQGGYRFLQFDTNVYGWDGPFEKKGHPQGYWTLRDRLNMSGYYVGISASF